jgi:hypothetical protein
MSQQTLAYSGESAEGRSSSYSGTAVGFTVFAAILMVTIGVFQAIAGIVALLNDEFYVVTQEWIFQFDVTTWGWVHLLAGVIVGLAGAALFTGAVWARTVAVALAVISAVLSFMWLPWYPIWAVIVIALDITVIWALTVHGRDIAKD